MREYAGAIATITVAVIAATFAFFYFQPNDGQARFRGDTITVNAEAATEWGADVSQLKDWGVPIEFVSGEADVEFVIAKTECREVPGFGRACVSGEAQKTMNSRRWITGCTVTLSDAGMANAKEATAVVTHEFGHCLGAKHNDDEHTPSIMARAIPSKNYAPANWSWVVTDADRASIPY